MFTTTPVQRYHLFSSQPEFLDRIGQDLTEKRFFNWLGFSNSVLLFFYLGVRSSNTWPNSTNVKSDQTAICLYSWATNLNTDKPIDIQSRPNRNE